MFRALRIIQDEELVEPKQVISLIIIKFKHHRSNNLNIQLTPHFLGKFITLHFIPDI
jgi:hypothetical protein